MISNVIAVHSSCTHARSLEVAGFRITEAEFGLVRSRRHEHERTLCSLTLSGSWRQAFDSRSYECTSGTALIKPGGVPHRDRFDHSGARLLLIELEPWRTAQLEACGVLGKEPRLVREAFVPPVARRLVAEMQARDSITSLAVEALLLELFAATGRSRQVGASGRAPAWLRSTQAWLDVHFQGDIRLEELARMTGCHPVRLARTFSRHYGLSIGAYVRRRRLDWVAQQLVSSAIPIAELATLAGFADQSHLNRWFRREMHTTPARYRQAALVASHSPLHAPAVSDPF